MALDARKKQVLDAIVDDYVSTYEPVGSKALIERHNFSVSSATLRNEMAELERLGLIEKPHTSAGRIPSDRGYREYVNSLMSYDNLTDDERSDIEDRICIPLYEPQAPQELSQAAQDAHDRTRQSTRGNSSFRWRC